MLTEACRLAGANKNKPGQRVNTEVWRQPGTRAHYTSIFNTHTHARTHAQKSQLSPSQFTQAMNPLPHPMQSLTWKEDEHPVWLFFLGFVIKIVPHNSCFCIHIFDFPKTHLLHTHQCPSLHIMYAHAHTKTKITWTHPGKKILSTTTKSCMSTSLSAFWLRLPTVYVMPSWIAPFSAEEVVYTRTERETHRERERERDTL